MNTRKLLMFLVVAGAAVPLIKKLWEISQINSATPKIDRSQVVPFIEETVPPHQGEESSVVQAFEAALAHETRMAEPYA